MAQFGSISALVCILAAGNALAGTTWDQGGQGTGTSSSTVTQIADNHMVMQVSSTYEQVDMESPDHPMNGASGPCFGAVEVSAGAASGGGICAFKDKAGDSVVLHWDAEAMEATGALTGSWTISGGTGPWAEASGGGRFSSLTDPASGNFVNTITSNLTLP
jgi:hypothetical protein